MKVLITGASGMLGRELADVLEPTEHRVTSLGRAQLDVTDKDAVRGAARGHDWIINCAAYTAVDDAEADPETAHAINAEAAGTLAEAAGRADARLIHISTDYVFDGTATEPYQENSPLNPLSVYGRTKAQGERLVRTIAPSSVILRTAWLYGEHGPNFVSAILREAQSHPTVSVLTDQRGQPTWTRDLANHILKAMDVDVSPGTYHATNAGNASRFEFAREIFTLAGLDPQRVVPASAHEHERPAPRPAYSVLGHEGWSATPLRAMRPWRDALAAAAESMSGFRPS